jgi:hypothetical protein
MYIKCSEWLFLALFIEHAMRMHSIILSSVACSGIPNFLYHLTNGRIFEKKKKLNIKCVFREFVLRLAVLRRIQRDIIHMYITCT